jgi:EAL domain-containing protein (putative c-di-GMP-specific phosphodiesterase class I)
MRVAGVHAIQGFRFGRPVEAKTITERLTTGSRAQPPAPRPITALAG